MVDIFLRANADFADITGGEIAWSLSGPFFPSSLLNQTPLGFVSRVRFLACGLDKR